MPDALAAARSALDAQADTLAKAFRESPEAVRKAIDAAAPAALASLIGRGESDEGARELQVALQDAQTGPELLNTLGTRLDGARLRGRASGAGLRLLGGRGAALVEQLAPFSGLKPASASALVDLVTPVLLAGLRRGGPNPTDAEAVRRLLRREAEAVNRDLPSAFQPRFSITLAEEPTATGVGRPGIAVLVWIVLVLVVLVAVAAVWWLANSHAHAHSATLLPLTAPLDGWPVLATHNNVLAVLNVSLDRPFGPELFSR